MLEFAGQGYCSASVIEAHRRAPYLGHISAYLKVRTLLDGRSIRYSLDLVINIESSVLWLNLRPSIGCVQTQCTGLVLPNLDSRIRRITNRQDHEVWQLWISFLSDLREALSE